MNKKTDVSKLIFLSVIGAVILLLLIVFLGNPAALSRLGNQNTSQTSNLIMPGSFPIFSCPMRFYTISSNITSTTGFRVYNVSGITDYVIAPDHIGTIIYSVYVGNSTMPSENANQIVTNWLQFYHSVNSTESSQPAYGVLASFNPAFEQLQLNSNYSVNATVAALANATEGTYWGMLSPGVCYGGPSFLITIGTSPYNGPALSPPVFP